MAKAAKGLITVGFDYGSLDKDVRGKLINLAGQISRGKGEYLKASMVIGEAISEAHGLLPEGKFSAWVEDQGFSRQSAYNYKNAWEKFGSCKTVLHMSQDAMYALAGDSVPPQAVKEAIRLADRGEKVTKKVAKQILLKFAANGHARSGDDDQPSSGDREPPTVAKKEPEAPELFSDAFELLRRLTLKLDEINNKARNEQLRREVADSLEVANQDLLKWRKASKK